MAQSQDVGMKSLLRIWPYVAQYKIQIVGALAALLLTSLVTLALGQGVKMVIDNGLLSGSTAMLNQTMAVVMTLVVLMAFGTYARFYLMTWLGERVIADLRNAVFRRIIYLHPSYFEENRSGELMSRLTTDTTLLQSIIGSSFSLALRSTLTVIGATIMLLITNLKLTLIVVAAVPLVLVPIMVIGRQVRTLSKDSQDRIADVGTYAGEIIRQIKTVQSYTRELFELQAFSGEVEKAFNVAKKRIQQRSLMMSIVILLAFTAIAAMVWVGGNDVMTGRMTGGELAAFVFYAIMVAFGVASVSEIIGELQRAAGATERLLELMAEESLIVDAPVESAFNDDASQHIVFEGVYFNYPSRPDKSALHDLTFSVAKGETVALVGPSGAGKSTVFEMLLRFYDPQAGTISVQGRDIRELKLWTLRKVMALVPQQPVLFSSDVFTNIRYGKLDATDEEVYAAAEAANAHEFILALPEGYSSYLGENGIRLSGGQKQRIVIARAILNNPEILLLDEATSALDAESEYQVQQALEKLMSNRTTIIIAHRLATVVNADRIVVMDQGKILAEGRHDVLIHQSGLYQRLAELQFNQGEVLVGEPASGADTSLSAEGKLV
jgi:ATP-binding cassette subfamily B protein